jgi:hypothetical protein
MSKVIILIIVALAVTWLVFTYRDRLFPDRPIARVSPDPSVPCRSPFTPEHPKSCSAMCTPSASYGTNEQIGNCINGDLCCCQNGWGLVHPGGGDVCEKQ